MNREKEGERRLHNPNKTRSEKVTDAGGVYRAPGCAGASEKWRSRIIQESRAAARRDDECSLVSAGCARTFLFAGPSGLHGLCSTAHLAPLLFFFSLDGLHQGSLVFGMRPGDAGGCANAREICTRMTEVGKFVHGWWKYFWLSELAWF